jgi:hypothetical protein
MKTTKSEPKAGGTEGEHGQGGQAGPAVDATVQGTLGRKLRESYQEVVDEEVPRKFLDLLNELKKKEHGSKKGGS